MSKNMPSVMAHSFSQVPKAETQRASFNRSHGYKTTFDAGNLVPVFVDEALPGDTFNLHMTAFARMATPLFPIMDNIFLDSFFFAVPIRLLWSNWEKFNGAQDNPADSTDYTIPQQVSPAGGYANESLQDYMGIPTKLQGISHSALFPRAYNLIYNEWFRDQNLQNSVVVDTGDGPDTVTDYVLLKRGKRHDYFTSCLPWPQKGTAVDLPLGTVAPVITDSTTPTVTNAGWTNESIRGTNTFSGLQTSTNASSTANIIWGDNTGMQADLTNATAATINQLRQAFQIQKLYERDARGGTRYIEIIQSHFGVTSPDYRLQRPEYLGGGSTMINVTPIAQTSESGTTAQGTLAAFATASISGHGFTKSFTEHCIIIGMVCARADLTYQQGLNRMFSRSDRFDFYWPALSHIGEQAVLNKEIYAQGIADPTADADVFGYQERYAEYRYKPSQITGKFRSNDAVSLDSWHLSQDFSALPALNSSFISEAPPISRVVAVPSEPEFIFDSYMNLSCARPMPLFGVPGLIDHF